MRRLFCKLFYMSHQSFSDVIRHQLCLNIRHINIVYFNRLFVSLAVKKEVFEIMFNNMRKYGNTNKNNQYPNIQKTYQTRLCETSALLLHDWKPRPCVLPLSGESSNVTRTFSTIAGHDKSYQMSTKIPTSSRTGQ